MVIEDDFGITETARRLSISPKTLANFVTQYRQNKDEFASKPDVSKQDAELAWLKKENAYCEWSATVWVSDITYIPTRRAGCTLPESRTCTVGKLLASVLPSVWIPALYWTPWWRPCASIVRLWDWFCIRIAAASIAQRSLQEKLRTYGPFCSMSRKGDFDGLPQSGEGMTIWDLQPCKIVFLRATKYYFKNVKLVFFMSLFTNHTRGPYHPTDRWFPNWSSKFTLFSRLKLRDPRREWRNIVACN